MADRSHAFTSGEGELEPVELTCERRVAGKDFEIRLRRDGRDWHWEARLAREDETSASGTITELERADRAITVIAWKLFGLIAEDANHESQPNQDAGGSEAQSPVAPSGKAQAMGASPSTQEQDKPRMVLTRLEHRSLDAFKAWIRGIMVGMLGEDEAAKRRTATEEDWVEAHRRFWAKVDAARDKEE